ncbi:MAG: helix-turn-helix domain-containing protein [Erysipelotrichaceae bacterium]|nr:helix-turn-helix domain-containing protein [Erysipelotrichaceae bacterium]
MKIGDRIKEAREKKGISQKQLAKLIGKSPTAMNNYEKYSQGLSPEIIIKLVKILDVTPNDLFQDYFDEEKNRFDEEERELVFGYRELDYPGKVVVRNNMEAESNRINDSRPRSITISRPYFKDLNSFTINNALQADVQRMPDTPYNHRADCLVKMYDDSMEPLYPKSCKLLVKNTDSLADHDTGVFRIGDQILIRRKENGLLKALNKNYPDLPYDDTVIVLGKILGRYK